MALGERDRLILDTERAWWQDGRTKSEIVRDRVQLSLPRYNQLLSNLIQSRDAEEYDPLLVRRLRRAKLQRRLTAMGFSPVQGRWER